MIYHDGNIPIYYDEDLNKWFFTLFGERHEFNSLKAARTALHSVPADTWRETAEPLYALVARDNLNNGLIAIGTRCEIVSRKHGYSCFVRGLEPAVLLALEDLVADTPENKVLLAEWKRRKEEAEKLPYIWNFAKTLQRPEFK